LSVGAASQKTLKKREGKKNAWRPKYDQKRGKEKRGYPRKMAPQPPEKKKVLSSLAHT